MTTYHTTIDSVCATASHLQKPNYQIGTSLLSAIIKWISTPIQGQDMEFKTEICINDMIKANLIVYYTEVNKT